MGAEGREEGLQGELKGVLKTARRWPESKEGHPREQEQHEPSLRGPEAAESRLASGSAGEDRGFSKWGAWVATVGHLELVRNASSQAPTQTWWIRNPGDGAPLSCFSKPSR